MSISINGFVPRPLALPSAEPDGRTEGGPGHGRSRTAPEPARAIGPGPEGAATAAPTADVDPRLWEMLSSQERSYYLRHAIRGPLTYGPSVRSPGPTSPDARLGGRIDIRA